MPADAGHDSSRGGSPGGLLLTVASVARQLGVAPATLRTWARRYGLGPSGHVSGTHRRYTPVDLRRLQAMRRLTLAGMQAADAARAVHDLADDEAATIGPVRSRWPGGEADPVAGTARLSAEDRRGAGDSTGVLADADPQQRGLARAAVALDQATVSETIRWSLEQAGVIATWERLLRPVLVAIGRRWELTGEGVEVEHLIAHTTEAVLRSYAVGAPEPASGRPILLAGVPGERHGLPLAALAAALAEEGVGSRVLGADMPTLAFVAAVRRTGPCVVLLWAHLPSTTGLELLDAMPVLRPPTFVVTGGQGWPVESLPGGVAYATGLAHAVELVLGAVTPWPVGPGPSALTRRP